MVVIMFSRSTYTAAAMLCKQTLFIIATFLTAIVRSLPSPSSDTELKVIKHYEVEGGNITWYGDVTPAKRSSDTVGLNRRCGTNKLKCSGSNQAPSAVCAGLAFTVAGPMGGQSTGQSPRSICFTASGQTSGECCVSWSNPVSNAIDNYFITSIIDINNGCMTQSGQVSGLTGDTSIGNTCTVVCLSNRPTGCNNQILGGLPEGKGRRWKTGAVGRKEYKGGNYSVPSTKVCPRNNRMVKVQHCLHIHIVPSQRVLQPLFIMISSRNGHSIVKKTCSSDKVGKHAA